MPDHRGRRIANPSPLGMFALAATTLMWSLFNARTRHIFEVNAIIGMALAVGGLCQLLAGMWEFAHGHTFGATAFTMLGGFWISYGIMYWPSSGALSSYTTTDHLGSALGIYFMVWMVVAFMLFLGTFRGSVPLAATFFLLFLTYLLIGAAHFNGRVGILRAGGVVGCIASVLAFYTGAVGLHNRDTTYYNTPAMELGKRRDTNETNGRY
ncbi:Gpr1 family protein [Ceratobasidium sp. AG-I]|nr:Gpr1 family protein [Ceratobasidium sp. AG-I]